MNDSKIIAAINEGKQIVKNINKDMEKISKDVKDINKKIENGKTITQSNVKWLTRIIKLIKYNLINIISISVAVVALYTSNKIAINSSALNFTYKNVDIEKVSFKEPVEIEVGKNGVVKGGAKIDFGVDVISGQISSLYLIYKKDGEFVFELLNNGEIQNKSSGVKSYNAEVYFDMEKRVDINGIPMGFGQLYVLSEDLNGQVNIDIIQIVGPVINEEVNGVQELYDNNAEYGFRYIKNNRLITLYDNTNADDEWINLTDSYPDVLKETDVEKIEEDIEKIREKYSKYKY